MDCIHSEQQLVAEFAKLRHAILENIQELLLRLFRPFMFCGSSDELKKTNVFCVSFAMFHKVS